ncbi:choline dehydrogenase [Phyllosticta citrichinensis]|uniref:Choline dehydrogenase n=1 Tax=Phyllosticta citrichinensis TaxID=1130410 RepID=A0ABR1Y8K6_9PEZI
MWLSAASLLVGSAAAAPLLDPILDPITDSIWTDLSSLVETSLGTLAGTLGEVQSFDYVVIGGGTGGNTMAYRLAEAGNSVAVIEVGGSFEIGKPVVGPAPLGGIIGIGSNPLDSIPTVDYVFTTTPQPGAAGREMHYPQGKCLGGSSALNFMLHHRPNKGSLDEWAKAVGDDSYQFDSFLPYFKKSMNFTPPNTETRPENATTLYSESDFIENNEDGAIQVTYPAYSWSWQSYVAKAFETLGFNITGTYDQGELDGWHYAQLTVDAKTMTRSTSAQWIYKARDSGLKGDLKVFTGTQATKILFDENKKAYGVQVQPATGVNGLLSYQINATKEVILSAGALHSPQLLMLSGIGPAAHLEEHGIEVLVDRPGVGQNLSDHLIFGPAYEVTIDTLDAVLANPVKLAAVVAEYATSATGPLTNNVAEMLAWERFPTSTNLSQATWDRLNEYPADWPQIEYFPAAGYIGDFHIPWAQQPKDGKQYASILATLLMPQSRGNVSLASDSAADKPLFNPMWLTDPADEEMVVAIYRRMREVMNTDVVKSIRASDSEYWPGDDVDSYDEILDNMRTSVMAIMHASCTCRMGKPEEETAVVDSKARVIGVDGLRIVDASAFAFLPPGHPSALIYALAEKISDDIINGK